VPERSGNRPPRRFRPRIGTSPLTEIEYSITRPQHQREGHHAQDRTPDHILAFDSIANGTAQYRAKRNRAKEHEEIHLRALHRNVKCSDEIEGIVTGQAGQVDVLGENEHHQNRYSPPHFIGLQTVRTVIACELRRIRGCCPMALGP